MASKERFLQYMAGVDGTSDGEDEQDDDDGASTTSQDGSVVEWAPSEHQTRTSDEATMDEEAAMDDDAKVGRRRRVRLPIDLGEEDTMSLTLVTRIMDAFSQFKDILECHDSSVARTPKFNLDDLEGLVSQWQRHWTEGSPDDIANRIIRLGDIGARGQELERNYQLLLDVHGSVELMLDYAGLLTVYKQDLLTIKVNMQHAFEFSRHRAMLSGRMQQRVNQMVANNQIDSNGLLQVQKLLVYLQGLITEYDYRKRGDRLYTPIWKDEHFTKAFTPLVDPVTGDECTIGSWSFAMTTAEKSPEMWKARTAKPQNMDFVVRDITRNREADAPLLQKTRNIWSFANGRYNGETDEFVPYGQPEPEQWAHLFSAKFIDSQLTDTDPVGPDCTFDSDTGIYRDHAGGFVRRYNKDTGEFLNEEGAVVYNERTGEGVKPPKSCMDISVPPYDQITKHQRWPHNVKYVHLALLGRLAFPVGKANGGDDLEVVPMTVGEAGTGKTSCVQPALEMYDLADIFMLESSGEETFQLMGAKGKLIWFWGEVRSNAKLAPDRFQQMVSGESVVAPVKGREKDSFPWTLPGYLVGNNPLSLPGSKGSIARRVVLFVHRYAIGGAQVDTSLKSSLKTQHLANYIRKIVCCRKFFLAEVGDRGIWDKGVLPEEFHRNRESVHASTNIIYDFIKKNCRFPTTGAAEEKQPGALEAANTISAVHDPTIWMMPLSVFVVQLQASMPRNAPKADLEDIISTLEDLKAKVHYISPKDHSVVEEKEFRMDLPHDVEIYNQLKEEQRRMEHCKSVALIQYQDQSYRSPQHIVTGMRMVGDDDSPVVIEFVDGTQLSEGEYVGTFLTRFYDQQEEGVILCSAMFQDYQDWCQALGLAVLTATKFNRALKARYVCKKASTGVRRMSCYGLVKKCKDKAPPMTVAEEEDSSDEENDC
jgi:hypothetical protein